MPNSQLTREAKMTRIERAGNFAGALLLSFASSEAIIGGRHYALYAFLAIGGAAALLLAHIARRKNRAAGVLT